MSKKLFFSTKGLNWDDDKAVEEFAQRVWAASVTEFSEDPAKAVSLNETDVDRGVIQ